MQKIVKAYLVEHLKQDGTTCYTAHVKVKIYSFLWFSIYKEFVLVNKVEKEYFLGDGNFYHPSKFMYKDKIVEILKEVLTRRALEIEKEYSNKIINSYKIPVNVIF